MTEYFSGMKFEEAMQAMRMGHDVKRHGWKNRYLQMVIGANPRIFETDDADHAIPWNPASDHDLVAEDWELWE
jgi:hypothetical protein